MSGYATKIFNAFAGSLNTASVSTDIAKSHGGNIIDIGGGGDDWIDDLMSMGGIGHTNYRGNGDLMLGSRYNVCEMGVKMSYEQYFNAYINCDPLSAVINYEASAFATGETWILKRRGKQKGEEVDTQEARKLKKLFEKPNSYQTKSQFEAERIIGAKVFGWVLIYLQVPFGSDNIDAKSMHVIHPTDVYFEYDNIDFSSGKYIRSVEDRWSGIKNISIRVNGAYKAINKANCYMYKDTMPTFGSSNIFPISRLDTIKSSIQNVIDGMESRSVLLRERGIRGLITNQTVDSNSFIPVTNGEKNELMNTFKAKFGMLRNQFQISFSNKNLKWQSMQTPVKDLMLFEEDANSVAKICDSLMFPKILLSDGLGKGDSNANIQTATRNMYQNAIIPMAKNDDEQFNIIFNTIDYGFVIERDYSYLPVLQPDRKEAEEAYVRASQGARINFEMGVIDLNEYRKKIDQDPKPEFEGVYIWDIKEKLNKAEVGLSNDITDLQLNDGTSMNAINNEGSLNQAI